MKPAEVSVRYGHYRREFTEATMMRYGSPHFSKKEAGEWLRKDVLQAARDPVATGHLGFQRSQIVCGNEVFPESAVADPIADLEVWDEWRHGTRAFPYPGKYSRLGLSEQPGKVSSTTSMGVLGEVFAGLFSQVVVSPWVLVRPIRRWPDFIYYTFDGRYAFVESKAFMTTEEYDHPLQRVPKRIIQDCLADTIQQLNADPFVRVWYAFTEAIDIRPLRVNVTFLELDAPDRRRERIEELMVPQAVIAGLAEQVLNTAAAEVFEDMDDTKWEASGLPFTPDLRNQIRTASESKFEPALSFAAPEALLGSVRKAVEIEFGERLKKLKKVPKECAGRQFLNAKRLAVEGRLARVRRAGDKSIYLADMPAPHRTNLGGSWKPSCKAANQRWSHVHGSPLWRCSSAVLALGAEELDGQPIA